jgi:ornithine carbamoyltransferase
MKYEDIAEFAKYSSIPCINLLCDKNHPTQAIADLLTIYNVFKTIKGLKVVFVGACNNNVARSLIEGLAMYGAHYVGIGPTLAHPSSEELAFYQKLAQENGGSVEFTTDINAVKDADVIYQDVFLDLGESMDL